MPAPSPSDATAAQAALEALAAAIDPRDHVTTLVTGTGRVPHLTVTSRHARELAEHVYAQDGWFWWSWAERIAPTADTTAAAAKVTSVLRTIPEPAHGVTRLRPLPAVSAGTPPGREHAV